MLPVPAFIQRHRKDLQLVSGHDSSRALSHYVKDPNGALPETKRPFFITIAKPWGYVPPLPPGPTSMFFPLFEASTGRSKFRCSPIIFVFFPCFLNVNQKFVNAFRKIMILQNFDLLFSYCSPIFSCSQLRYSEYHWFPETPGRTC